MLYRRVLCVVAALFAVLLPLSGCGTGAAPKGEAPPQVVLTAGSEAEEGQGTQQPAEGAGSHSAALTQPAVCAVFFINVGRADATLVQAGERNYLIDTGEKSSVVDLIAGLHIAGVTALDGVFLTHTHSDHIGGFAVLAREFPIARVYRAAISENRKDGSNKIDERAADAGLSLTELSAGDTVPLADGLAFEVLGPLEYNAEDDNDNSLVLRLSAAGATFLFAGDMQFAEEETLLRAGVELAADVLKVGNHGNPDATGEAFGAAVSPRYAVIPTDRSLDANSANARVIAALGDAEVIVTDETEAGVLITVAADGTLRVSEPRAAAQAFALSIVSVDRGNQTAVIKNNGADADISGCMLFSERGGELFRFPGGTILPGGQTVTVSGEGGGGEFRWTGEAKPWNTKKDDAALLYDPLGNLLSRFD